MINAVGYDTKTQTLTVVFNSGKVYEYAEVPPEVHRGLIESGSKGSYMRGIIIDCYPTSLQRKRGRR